MQADGGNREAAVLGQVGQVGGDELGRSGRERLPRPRVQTWKDRQAEAYIFRVFSETLLSREWRSLWMSASMRLSAAGAGMAPVDGSLAGSRGFWRAII